MKCTFLKTIFCFLTLAFTLCCAANSIAQKRGQRVIDSLTRLVPTVKEDKARATLMTQIGNQYTTVNPDSGSRYAGQALVLSQSLGWEAGAANAYNILGICAFYKADNARALQHWEQAARLFRHLGDKKGILKVVGNMGGAYVNEGNYPKGLEKFFRALKYAEDLDDQNSIAINIGNIGSAYEYLKEYSKALTYDLKAVRLFTRLNDKQSVAIYLANIAVLYSDLKDYKASIIYGDSALKLDREIGDKEGIARSLLNQGSTYASMSDFPRALDAYSESLAIGRAAGFKSVESKAFSLTGETLLMIHKDTSSYIKNAFTRRAALWNLPADTARLLASAIQLFKQSIQIDSVIGNLNELSHSYELLSRAQAQMDEPVAALQSYKLYTLFKDSITSTESKLKVANLETQREIDLKDKQIEIDRLAVAKKRNERVLFIAGIGALLLAGGFLFRNVRLRGAKSLSEYKLQALQAQMNPHFIFNSLNSIQRIILQSDKMLAATYLADFSKLMRRILDNSHEQFVSLDAIVETLRMYVHLEEMRFNNEFNYEFRLDEDLPLEELKLPPMLLQPYVENAILHGLMPKDGPKMLLIQLQERDGALHCIIEDNGVGRAAPKVRNGHISRGEALTKGMRESLNSLLNIKATISYTDLKDATGEALGTRVEIIIPTA